MVPQWSRPTNGHAKPGCLAGHPVLIRWLHSDDRSYAMHCDRQRLASGACQIACKERDMVRPDRGRQAVDRSRASIKVQSRRQGAGIVISWMIIGHDLINERTAPLRVGF